MSYNFNQGFNFRQGAISGKIIMQSRLYYGNVGNERRILENQLVLHQVESIKSETAYTLT